MVSLDIGKVEESTFKLRLDLPSENLQFTGRRKELQLLAGVVKGAGKGHRKVAVLHGLGGIGKTDIVLHYAWQNSPAYTSIIWIYAASTETLKQSFLQAAEGLIQHLAKTYGTIQPDYLKIASDLGIHGLINASGQLIYQAESSDYDKITAAVLRWLCIDGNDNWLLVFDNVDDMQVIDRGKHFPKSPSGTIIITSRRRGLVHWASGSFEVDDMRQNDALDLLMKRAQLNWNELSEAGTF